MKSIDEINQLADHFDSKGLADNSVLNNSEPGEAIGKVGEVYNKVRPFLEAVGSLFFVPKKWRLAIMTFIVVMDGLTITSNEE